MGLIEIGWRKRVISINWEDTGIKCDIPDDVTKTEFSAHAWSYHDAIKYLDLLRKEYELRVD